MQNSGRQGIHYAGNWGKGFPLGGRKISNIRYVHNLFQRIEAESGNIGLPVNRAETKVMIVDIPGIHIVDRYVCLGFQICSKSSCVPEVKK